MAFFPPAKTVTYRQPVLWARALLDMLTNSLQIHEREAQLADLAAAYEALQQQHSQDVQALQAALHKARSHARQLEQRWALRMDVLLCQRN